MELSKKFRSLMDVSGKFILIKFSRIPGLVKSKKILRHRVDMGGNLRLMDFSGFPKFQFRVRMVRCRTFLLIIRGSKQKLKVILINNYFIYYSKKLRLNF